jgi:hypothetical protein
MMCYNMCMDEIEQKLRIDLAAANAEADRQRKRADAEAQLRAMGKLTRSEDRLNKLAAENAALRERITELENQPYRVEIEQTRAGRSTCKVFREGVSVFHGIAPDSETHASELQARIDKALALADEWDSNDMAIDRVKSAFQVAADELREALAADTPTPTDRCRCGHIRGDHWKGLVPPKVGICAGSTCGCQGFAADTPTTATAEGSDIPEGHVQIAPHGHPEGWNCNCVGIYAPSVEPEPMTAEIGVRLVCRDGDHELCPTGCPCACACHAATAEGSEQ